LTHTVGLVIKAEKSWPDGRPQVTTHRYLVDYGLLLCLHIKLVF